MKVVHKNEDDAPLSFSECMTRAKTFEANDDIEGAVKLYEKCIRFQPTNEQPYNRLMILYRKQKEYKKELAIINKGIKAFEDLYTSSRPHGNTITSLSKKLLKSTGLADKKGKLLFEPQPILRWRKREMLVKKRLTA